MIDNLGNGNISGMKVNLITGRTDLEGTLIQPVYEGEKSEVGFKEAEQFLKENPKFGKLYESQLIFTDKGRVLLLGLGKKEKVNFGALQNWAAAAVRLQGSRTEKISFIVPVTEKVSSPEAVKALGLGVELGAYDPSQTYKTEKQPLKLKEVRVILEKVNREEKDALKEAETLAGAMNLVRNLGDMPANEMTPTYFLSVARKVAKANGLKLTVIDEAKAKRVGMGAFLAVTRGSDEPGYVIALEYRGKPGTKEKWGLVGKGITFDSGGISIKPDQGMNEMKYDMSGAATVLAVAQAVALMKLKTNFVAVCVVAENMPGSKAMRPGDIVKSRSGKTVEVLSTDAEGRMLLIDGLTLAQRDFKATKLIDVATLTGAVIVALGDFITGVFTNKEEFGAELVKIGKKTGEKFWLMPMDEIYDEMLKSDFADINNIGRGGSSPRAAGAITGAKFMERVIEDDRPWIHLDIAGTAWDMKPRPYRSVGATGETVKTLVELIKES